MQKLKLIECPRDAMQGLHKFIDTEDKIDYINYILKCGFDTVDFGSFVSHKAIPQLKDTVKVLEGLDDSDSKLLAIVVNERGANNAVIHERIKYLGFPFSVSEEFQKRNSNATIEASFSRVEKIQELALKNNKELLLYLSMAFGNPYGEKWHPDIVTEWAEKLHKKLGINTLAVSDTIGCASTESVNSLFSSLIPSLPGVEFGAHLHTVPHNAQALVESAYTAGCRRFDGAIKGFGGCPMATNTLTGNMPTELMIDWFNANDIETNIDTEAFQKTIKRAMEIFP